MEALSSMKALNAFFAEGVFITGPFTARYRSDTKSSVITMMAALDSGSFSRRRLVWHQRLALVTQAEFRTCEAVTTLNSPARAEKRRFRVFGGPVAVWLLLGFEALVRGSERWCKSSAVNRLRHIPARAKGECFLNKIVVGGHDHDAGGEFR